ncbi:MAG: RNA polymerase sigma factor [Flavobacteriales bacterium]|jgi:RNA polymerase sigma factor (sigma-70 family)
MSDHELLEMLTDPERRSKGVGLFIRQFQKPIYYYIRRMVLSHEDADDLTQQVFIKAWKSIESFRGESKLSTWLYRIAHNETISFLRSAKRIMQVDAGAIEHALGRSLQEDVLFSGDEIQARLQTAIALLPEKQKAVFVMRYYDELKYEEMAEITGTSVGALKASYHHAVQKIEAYFTEK